MGTSELSYIISSTLLIKKYYIFHLLSITLDLFVKCLHFYSILNFQVSYMATDIIFPE